MPYANTQCIVLEAMATNTMQLRRALLEMRKMYLTDEYAVRCDNRYTTELHLYLQNALLKNGGSAKRGGRESPPFLQFYRHTTICHYYYVPVASRFPS